MSNSRSLSRYVLCDADELGHGESRGFEVGNVSLFVVRQQARVYAYRNHCPHTGASLNWQNDNFLSFDGSLIQCALHGALFQIEDGICIWGPCVRQRLNELFVKIENGSVILDLSAADSPRWRDS